MTDQSTLESAEGAATCPLCSRVVAGSEVSFTLSLGASHCPLCDSVASARLLARLIASGM